jgi:hypothetical protein
MNKFILSLVCVLALSFGVYAQTQFRATGQVINAQVGTSYAILNKDGGKLITFSNASPVAASIGQAGTGGLFATYWFVDVRNLGAGTVTITPTTSTIGGSSSLALTTGLSARIISNGTNYIVTALSGSGTGTVNTSGSPANGNLAKFTGPATVSTGDLTGVVNTAGTLTTTPGKADVMQTSLYCSDAGSTDAYACSLSPAITAYVLHTAYRFKANTANTGAATVNLNSLGAITIKKVQGAITTDLVDNDIRVGQEIVVIYDGTNMQMVSQLGNAPSGSGAVNSGTANFFAYYPSTGTTVDDNPRLSDNGTTLDYSGTGGLTVPKISTGGAADTSCDGTAGCIILQQGTQPSGLSAANGIQDVAPTSVTAYRRVRAGAAATGVVHWANSANVVTESVSPVTLSDLATQAADTVVMNASGSTAVPTAVAVNNCGDASHALSYSTSTHTWGCQAISSGGGGTPGGSTTQVQYNNAGAFGGISNATTDGTTLTLTSAKVVTQLNDTNANSWIKVTATGSAVNQLTISNAATGAGPTLSATGSDTNIDLNLTPKGTGSVNVGPSPDVGIAEVSAGVLEVNSGAVGTKRDLSLRNALFNGTNGGMDGTEGNGSSLTAATSHDLLYPDSTAHRWAMNNNNAGKVILVGIASAGTSGNCVKLATNGIDIVDNGSACGTSSGVTIGTTTISSGVSGRLLFDNAGVVGEDADLSFSVDTLTVTKIAATTFTGDVTHSGAAIILSGNITAPAWTTNGVRIKAVPSTLTDSSSSGTVAAAYTNVYGGNTIAASSATTYSDYITTVINPPTAGTNVTFTRGHSLGILDSTSAVSSITGGLVITAAFGTTATSVGIGGGNVNAGGNGTFGGTLSVIGHATLEGVTSTGATGTGKFVFDATPTFTTNITAPLLIGGTGTTSTLTLRSTSGVGATGADIVFQTGNNGATEVGRITNAGVWTLGTGTNVTVNPPDQSGTNTAGNNMTIIGGLGTSQGAPGRVALQGGAMLTASGATVQTAVDRFISGASKVLTNNSATTVANITVASNTVAAVTFPYGIEVFNGTDLQVEEGVVSCHVTNKAGTIANNTCVKAINQQAATSGTLTVTWAISAANPAVLSVNANSSLTPSAGYPRVVYNLHNVTNQAVAIQ